MVAGRGDRFGGVSPPKKPLHEKKKKKKKKKKKLKHSERAQKRKQIKKMNSRRRCRPTKCRWNRCQMTARPQALRSALAEIEALLDQSRENGVVGAAVGGKSKENEAVLAVLRASRERCRN